MNLIRGRNVLWAVLAVFVLAAGALLLVRDGSGGDPPQLRISLGADGGGAAEAADASMSMLVAPVTYVAGDDLPALGGEGTVYELTPASRDDVVRLADALGLDAEVRSIEGGFQVESDAGSLFVSANHWSFVRSVGDENCVASSDGVVECSIEGSSGSVGSAEPVAVCPDGAVCDPAPPPPDVACDPGADCDVAVPEPEVECDPDEDCLAAELPPAVECGPAADCLDPAPEPKPVPEPERPEGLPTAEEAESLVADVLAEAGIDLTDAVIEVSDAFSFWSVSVSQAVDGRRVAGLDSYMSVGPDGVIQDGGGVLGELVELGSYPLVDTGEAIDRLNEFGPFFGGFGGPVPLGAPAAADAVAGSSGESSGGAVGGCPPGAGCGTDETAPTDQTDTAVATCDAPGQGNCQQPPGATECEVTSQGPGDGCAPSTTSIPTTTLIEGEICEPQSDGSEICEVAPGVPEPVPCSAERIEGGTCDVGGGPGVSCDVLDDGTEVCDVEPLPLPIEPPFEPEVLTVTLDEAEQGLAVVGAFDASTIYVVPAYVMDGTDQHGEEWNDVVALAVADEFLGAEEPGPVPRTEPPEPPRTEPVPDPCLLVEHDGTGTTHTVQVPACEPPLPAPEPTEPGTEPIELTSGQPEVGVPYYTDVFTRCDGRPIAIAIIGDSVWLGDADTSSWAAPTEGGRFTVLDDGTAEFVGDAARTKVADFRRPGPAEDPINVRSCPEHAGT